MSNKITAPFSPEAVQALNEYQTATCNGMPFHPFTCANRSDPGHGREGGDLGTLIATQDGWVCPVCSYTQDWAHTFMADPNRKLPALPFDESTDRDRAPEILSKVNTIITEYEDLLKGNPGAAGVDVMLVSMRNRKDQLEILLAKPVDSE